MVQTIRLKHKQKQGIIVHTCGLNPPPMRLRHEYFEFRDSLRYTKTLAQKKKKKRKNT